MYPVQKKNRHAEASQTTKQSLARQHFPNLWLPPSNNLLVSIAHSPEKSDRVLHAI